MQQIDQVYNRLQKKKKERRELNKMIKDELKNDERYQEIREEMKALRDERKVIENEYKAGADGDKLEELKVDIQSDRELLSDLALNLYIQEETVEIVDDYDVTWYPRFRVTFKRAN